MRADSTEKTALTSTTSIIGSNCTPNRGANFTAYKTASKKPSAIITPYQRMEKCSPKTENSAKTGSM